MSKMRRFIVVTVVSVVAAVSGAVVASPASATEPTGTAVVTIDGQGFGGPCPGYGPGRDGGTPGHVSPIWDW